MDFEEYTHPYKSFLWYLQVLSCPKDLKKYTEKKNKKKNKSEQWKRMEHTSTSKNGGEKDEKINQDNPEDSLLLGIFLGTFFFWNSSLILEFNKVITLFNNPKKCEKQFKKKIVRDYGNGHAIRSAWIRFHYRIITNSIDPYPFLWYLPEENKKFSCHLLQRRNVLFLHYFRRKQKDNSLFMIGRNKKRIRSKLNDCF